MNDSKKLLYFAPGRALFFASLVLILIGTALLALPICRTASVSLFDLFFTATSAVCVTGMFTVPITHFTLYGQLVLLLLLQIGGISLITFTILIVSRFIHFGLSGQLKAQQFAEMEIGKEGKSLLPFILVSTLALEAVGAAVIFSVLRHDYSWSYALLISCFQAMSAFCNIGVSLFGYDIETHAHSIPILLATAFLMFCGSLGFPVLKEIAEYCKQLWAKRPGKIFAFSLQTKIILYGSVIITFLGMLFLYLAEYGSSMVTMSPLEQFVSLLFNAISFRSAGFTIIPVGSMTVATLIIMMFMGFIGSSPGSTGSGVKIPSFAIAVATIRSIMSGHTNVRLGNRSIAIDQVIKAFALIVMSAFWIFIITFALALTDPGHSLLEITLEVSSAFTNLGISAGITETLSCAGKWLILISMLVGRVGSLAFILAWAKRSFVKSKRPYSYPEERIMLE